MKRILLTLFVFLFMTLSVIAQNNPDLFRALGTPEDSKVQVSWNRYLTHSGITDLSRKLAEAHPDFIKLSSIGDSYEGRELWMLTITNHNNKPHTEKRDITLTGTFTPTRYRARKSRSTRRGTWLKITRI